MASTGGARGFNLATLRRVRKLWGKNVKRISLSDLKARSSAQHNGDINYQQEARLTHSELKVRIAHRLKDFLFLPYKAMAHPSVRSLYDKYCSAYALHEQLSDITSEDDALQYWSALAHILEGHGDVTRLLGHSRQQLVALDPHLGSVFDSFLDRFFVSRIGTHLLGASFLQHCPAPQGAKKPAGVAMGVLQPTNPANFIRDLAGSLGVSGEGYSAPVSINGATDVQILYVPAHLRVILREVLRNSMEATARMAEQNRESPNPIQVHIRQGQNGVFVTVSDKGGGIDSIQRVWRWGPNLPDREHPDVEWCNADTTDSHPRLLPHGFGLPLARLTARYFGGDLRLQTLVGYGTNAYIHIPELRQHDGLGLGDSGVPF